MGNVCLAQAHANYGSFTLNGTGNGKMGMEPNGPRSRSLSIEFFTVCTKLAEMAILYSKDLTTAKKVVTSSGARPDATDYYWFRSPVPNQMSLAGICL